MREGSGLVDWGQGQVVQRSSATHPVQSCYPSPHVLTGANGRQSRIFTLLNQGGSSYMNKYIHAYYAEVLTACRESARHLATIINACMEVVLLLPQ